MSSRKPSAAAVTDAGDREALGEKTAVSLDDREDEDEEAPEREGVRGTWDLPAQEPLLADDFSRPRPRRYVRHDAGWPGPASPNVPTGR